jgi:hypothetical protein
MKQVACLSFNLSLRNFSRQALDPGLLHESLRPLKVKKLSQSDTLHETEIQVSKLQL